MEKQKLIILISSVENEIQKKESQIQHLRSIQRRPHIHDILPLPRSLPKPIPPPSTTALRFVRMFLQTRKRREQKYSKRTEIEKSRKSSYPQYAKWKAQSGDGRTTAFNSYEVIKEKRDLQLVSYIHGLRSNSPGAARKLRAIRRRQEISNSTRGSVLDFEKRRARIPPNPETESGRQACKRLVNCMSPRIVDVAKYVEMSNLINPWTVSEKFHFLKLYTRFGKDFGNIARHMTYKSVHDCVCFYYTQKLHLGLKGMMEKVEQKKTISDEYLMSIATTGVFACSLQNDSLG